MGIWSIICFLDHTTHHALHLHFVIGLNIKTEIIKENELRALSPSNSTALESDEYFCLYYM